MVFSFLLSIAAIVVFGLAPAIQTSDIDLNDALKEGSRGSSGGRRLMRESMVAIEVAASLILLIGAGLLVRSFIRLQSASPGFRSENVLIALISLPITDYPLLSRRIAFQRALLERVRALPGVQSAGAIDYPPFSGGSGSHIEIIGHPQNPNEPTQVAYQTASSSGYLETMGIPLLRGRRISSSDDQGAVPVCDIDDMAARKFFANLDPIGMQVVLPIPKITCTIVGLVGATKFRDLSSAPAPRIYYSSGMPFPRSAW